MMLFAPRLDETSPVRSRLACGKHQANGVLHYETRVAPTAPRQFVSDAARRRGRWDSRISHDWVKFL